MIVYRIVKDAKRAHDLSGKGAFLVGGRWNSEGIFMLYTSESQSLAFLETLVHFDPSEIPQHLYVMKIDISDSAPLYRLPSTKLPKNWRDTDHIQLKEIGDNFCRNKRSLVMKVPSAVLPTEFNYVLNPLFPRFHDLVKVVSVEPLAVDKRFGH
ncbi:RES domain-containing protein [Chitinophaga skermanii]|uniref:RES domain-containing protein n=1 Tax=Chitinophaga skermanii TaxID=331697 RepID=A0A327R2X7_9BACT|nr:RES family NAD+ phosphorylase [Chitinophaga skermanii]RAJ10991.1 RES domain-containing protein [Chitinophaga skermanii]